MLSGAKTAWIVERAAPEGTQTASEVVNDPVGAMHSKGACVHPNGPRRDASLHSASGADGAPSPGQTFSVLI